MALSDSHDESGAWFSRYNQHGIASLIAALSAIPDVKATFAKSKTIYGSDPDVAKFLAAQRTMRRLSADEQAACRRVCIGFVDPKQYLLTDDTVNTLRAGTKAKAAEAKARRAAASSEC